MVVGRGAMTAKRGMLEKPEGSGWQARWRDECVLTFLSRSLRKEGPGRMELDRTTTYIKILR